MATSTIQNAWNVNADLHQPCVSLTQIMEESKQAQVQVEDVDLALARSLQQKEIEEYEASLRVFEHPNLVEQIEDDAEGYLGVDDDDSGIEWKRDSGKKHHTKPIRGNVIVENECQVKSKNGGSTGSRRKSAQQTLEAVLDARTEGILAKFINKNVINSMEGLIQSGKESNVYYASGIKENGLNKEYAIKIFRTNLNEFSNRTEYLPKRLIGNTSQYHVTVKWAEREFGCLHKVFRTGIIPCPEPIELREHVLVLSFIGKNNVPAPRLRDVTLTLRQSLHCYAQILQYVRDLYHKVKVVHGDLSEYNILYFQKRCWLIDFGQAIEVVPTTSHLEYLARDLQNVNRFFKKCNLPECDLPNEIDGIFPVDQLLQFVTMDDENLHTSENIANILKFISSNTK